MDKSKLNKLRALRSELTEFEDEFDTSDPEWTQIQFNEHVSNLIKRGVVKTNKLPRKVRLTELLELLLGPDLPGDVLEAAESFDNNVHSYGGEATRDEMRQALEAIHRIVEFLNTPTKPSNPTET